MVQIGLLSDTHSHLPEAIFEHFKDVNEIWHAGDFGDLELIYKLQNFKPMRGVYGNIDSNSIRAIFPETLSFTIEGLKVCMKHIGGYPPKYNPATKPWIIEEQPGLFISGHSHILKVLKDSTMNCLHLNPGACGHQGWHKVKTFMRFGIEAGMVKKLEVIEL